MIKVDTNSYIGPDAVTGGTRFEYMYIFSKSEWKPIVMCASAELEAIMISGIFHAFFIQYIAFLLPCTRIPYNLK